MDIRKLEDNIDTLKLDDLKKLLKSKHKDVARVIKNRLIYLSKYGNTDKIANESFKLIKENLDKDDLIYLSEYGKTDKIAT